VPQESLNVSLILMRQLLLTGLANNKKCSLLLKTELKGITKQANFQNEKIHLFPFLYFVFKFQNLGKVVVLVVVVVGVTVCFKH